MASLNKVQIIGNAGRDPEVKYSANGLAVANLSIATTRTWKDKQGEKAEETEWHRVVFYDKLAEIVGRYTKKGSPLYIEGRLKTRKWQDKDGRDVYTTEIVAEQMQMLGGREEAAPPPTPSRPAPPGRAPARPAEKTAFDDIDDAIPF